MTQLIGRAEIAEKLGAPPKIAQTQVCPPYCGTAPQPPTPVPTLSGAGLIVAIIVLAAIVAATIHRNQKP